VAPTSPITGAAINAAPNPSTWMPGSMLATIRKATPFSNQRINKCRTVRLYCWALHLDINAGTLARWERREREPTGGFPGPRERWLGLKLNHCQRPRAGRTSCQQWPGSTKLKAANQSEAMLQPFSDSLNLSRGTQCQSTESSHVFSERRSGQCHHSRLFGKVNCKRLYLNSTGVQPLKCTRSGMARIKGEIRDAPTI
jgi:hypothetical protein